MAGIRPSARAAMTPVREILRVHLRTIVPVGLVVIAGILVLALLAGVYAAIIGFTAYQSLVESISSIETWTAAVAVILVPLALLALLASLVWAGTATQAASAAFDKTKTWMPGAAWAALRRAPKALAVILATLAAVIGATVAAPAFLIIGIAGLIMRRGRRELLIPMAIPFGVAVLVLVRWSLGLPAVWLDGLGVRAALTESSRRVKGRGPSVAAILLAALIVNLGITEGAAALVADPLIQLGVRIGALILLGAIPFVALTVLYRRGSDKRPAPLPAPVSRRARLAAAVAISLVLPLVVSVSPGSAASDASAAPGTTVTLTQYFSETLVGQDFLLDAQVTGTAPTGNLTFEAVPTSGPAIALGTFPLDGLGRVLQGVGAGLAAGDYQLIARYLGDAGNAASAATPLAHTVSVPTALIGVSSVAAASGDAATLTITLTPNAPATGTPTGTVTVTGGGHSFGPVAVNGSGVAVLLVDVAVAGTRELTVSYSGDAQFVSGSTLYTVPRIPTTMNVFGANVRSVTYGASEIYDGTVFTTTGTTPTGTVQLIWQGAVAATGVLTAGAFSITTDELRVGTGAVTLQYVGDASHAPSTGPTVQLAVAQTTTGQVISVSPVSSTIGAAATLSATLDDTGAGPGGTVTFNTPSGDFLGTATIVNRTASISWIPVGPVTFITATYSGDNNFIGGTSAAHRIDSDRAPVTVSITDPGPVNFGDIFVLAVKVKVGATGLAPDHGVDFVTSTGTVLVSNVYVDSAGDGSQAFCARVSGCPAGTIALGASDLDIIASYGESSINLLGQSAPYEYEPDKAGTITTLVVNPTTVTFGSGVNLTATVARSTPGPTPTGYVTFYGVEPVAGGGTALSFLGTNALVGGVATLTTSSGDGVDQLRWPANAVTAIYNADGALYKASAATVAVSLGRVGTSVALRAVSPQINTPTQIEATLSHDPGASADYRGKVTFTADTGDTCEAFVTAGQRVVNCYFTWTTVATHSVSAVYSGDVVYLPSAIASISVPITSATHTPVLAADAPSNVIVGADVPVTWRLTDVSQTGTVTVWGDGTQWCQVAVAVQACTGQFGIASATGGLVDIRVRYSGDSAWHGVEEIRMVRVTRCAVLDVRGNDASLGSVRVDTVANCGASGYLPGTRVQVTAIPKAPAEFGYWLGYRTTSPNLVLVSSTATTSFIVTDDTSTWVHVARFRTPCSAITASVQGFGGLDIYPRSNCTTGAGEPGWLYDTKVAIYPDGHYNPTYDEPDAFWSFRTLPSGAVAGADSSGRPLLRLTVTSPAVVGLIFGPVCREVDVIFDPATEGDRVESDPAHNCSAPSGGGYLRGTEVSFNALSGDPSLAISGWLRDGVPAPDLGTANDQVVVIDQVMPTLTVTLVHCYTVTVDVDGVTTQSGEPTAEVRLDGTPCPDGSDRFLGGTEVTLTPEILKKGTQFNGWDEHRIKPEGPVSGDVGDVTTSARTMTVDRDIAVRAGFFAESACSTLRDVGTPGLLTFPFSGCGPGHYLDSRKQQAAVEKVPVSEITGVKTYGTIITEVDQDGPLGVYVSVLGDAPTCTKGAPADRQGFQSLGLVTAKSIECRASGPISIWADHCQPVVTHPEFTVKGRTETYGAESMPSTFYVTGPDGVVRPSPGFQWGQAMPVEVLPGGKYRMLNVASGPCAATGNLFAPNTDILLYASAPGSGFRFEGWTGFGSTTPVKPSPMHRITNSTETALSTGAAYTVTCHTVTFSEGIRIEGDAPRCPGTSDADNSFIAGTAIMVRAEYQIGDRTIQKFSSGVVGDQVYEDPMTLDLIGFAYVDGDKNVAGLYQNRTDRINTEIIKGLKFGAGVTAIILPIFIGMVFPPAGIFFGVVGAMAGILSVIPGADMVAGVFDLVNPTKITACIARWGFNNPGTPGNQNVGNILSTAKTTATAVFTETDVLVQNIGLVGVVGGAASLGYGLYDAGIGGANLIGPQSVEELEDRSTITGCLDEQWRVTGSNLSGTTGGVPAAP